MKQGYHQVRFHVDSRQVTCMSTPRGPRQWKVVPMGIINGNAIFQRLMEEELEDFWLADAYVDDTIVGSRGILPRRSSRIMKRISDQFSKDSEMKNWLSVPADCLWIKLSFVAMFSPNVPEVRHPKSCSVSKNGSYQLPSQPSEDFWASPIITVRMWKTMQDWPHP